MKKYLAIILAAALLLSLAACKPGEKPVTGTPTDEPAPTEQVTPEPTEVQTEALTEAPTEAPKADRLLAPIGEHPLPDDPIAKNDCVKDAELMLYLPYGNDDLSVGYADPDYILYDQPAGPQAFAVSEGRVFVLDWLNSRVIISENGELRSFDTVEGWLHCICVVNDVIYVGFESHPSSVPGEIVAYDMQGNELERITIPENDVSLLMPYSGRLAILDYQGNMLVLEEGKWVDPNETVPAVRTKDGRYFLEIGDKSADLDIMSEEETLSIYWWMDNAVIVKANRREDIGDGNYSDHYRCLIYNREGELIGMTCVDADLVRFLPANPVYIDENGELYFMAALEDGVYITKPHLRTE